MNLQQSFKLDLIVQKQKRKGVKHWLLINCNIWASTLVYLHTDILCL
jgi:hypothetical protein